MSGDERHLSPRPLAKNSKAARNKRLRRGILPNGRSAHPHDPYASIPSTLLTSNRYRRLSPKAKAMHLLYEASYVALRDCSDGKSIVPHIKAMKVLAIGDASAGNAPGELVDAGILVLIKEPIRPGGMGGSIIAGRAAVYDLPHRSAGALYANFEWYSEGGPVLEGYWRIHSAKLRNLVEKIGPDGCAILAVLHSKHHTAEGGLHDNSARSITAILVGLSKTKVARVLTRLVTAGVLRKHETAKGRRAASYVLTDDYSGGAKASEHR